MSPNVAIFVVFPHFLIFCWTSLKLRLVEVDKGPFQGISSFYEHFKRYMFWYSEQTRKFILIFTIFIFF